ncbi:MAG: 5-bromo-4-chloroindolyl phosphate hydrolysis family protein [Bacillus sp. (in: firmicutes)]
MKPVVLFFMFLLRLSLATAVFVIAGLVFFLALDLSVLLSVIFALVASLVVFYGIKGYMHNNLVKSSGLTRSEYKYIQSHLRDAKLKIGRLQKAMFSVRNVITIKQNYEVLQVAKKIQSIVENEPVRFYRAEDFYYSHLDSMVELTEKYAFLTKQPAKTHEIKDSLNETRVTISSMADTIRQDLYKILNEDIEDLRVELDVAKNSIDKNKDPNAKS